MQLPSPHLWSGSGFVHGRHRHLWQEPWSRRRLMQSAAGGAALVTLAGRLARSSAALADSSVPPIPIPGGSPGIEQLAGRLFHVYGPGPEGVGIDPIDAEPSTITDFSGEIGLAYISGMCRRTNRMTGEVRELPFINNDMRYMAGAYRGVDGQVHEGTFAFI